MDRLDELEAESIYILREAYKNFGKLGMLWSMGKDSTVMLWLAKKAFFGNVPFPLLHIDTTYLFDEMYDFKQKVVDEWNVDMITHTNQEALDEGISYDTHDPMTVSHELKTVALKQLLENEGFEGLFLAIRGDEEGSRGKERIFSKRDSDGEWDYTEQAPEMWGQYNTDFEKGAHLRIHPILNWTEIDIWRYIKREDIPVVDLYFAEDGQRYRTLGAEPITDPIESDASDVDEIIEELEETKTAERSGRQQDQEESYALQKLREKGYM